MDADNVSRADPPDAPRGPHTQVTVDDLRRLLAAPDDRATLVLTAGRIDLETDTEAVARSLAVVTRAELAARVGTDPDPTALGNQAAELNTEIRLLGS